MAGKTQVVRHALIGFGARNAELLKHAVIAFLAQRDTFKEIGLQLEFDVYSDRNAPAASEKAYIWDEAWAPTQDGAIRTAAPVSAPLRGVEKIQPDVLKVLQDAVNVDLAIRQEIRSNRAALEGQYQTINPAAHALLQESSLPLGDVDVTQPFGIRSTMGVALRRGVWDVVNFVKDNIPEIRIYFHWDAQVTFINLSDSQKPRLWAQKDGDVGGNLEDGDEGEAFDFVHNAQGLLKVQYFDPEPLQIEHRVFTAHPNFQLMVQQLAANGLLSNAGLLQVGSKIGIVGLGSSAYDYASILLRLTDIVEITNNGWRINETNARRWPGLLTFISPNNIVRPPLHFRTRGDSSDMRWPPFETRSLISTEELHALTLQINFDWTSVALPLLLANVALLTNKDVDSVAGHYLKFRPSEVDAWVRMAEYHEQNQQYEAGNVTEMALLRLGQQLLTNGHGLEAYPEDADRVLSAKAPLTRRRGAAARKAAAEEVSRLRHAATSLDYRFIEFWNLMQSWNKAAPVPLQDMMAQLFALGVAHHQQASTDDFSASTTHADRVAVRDRTYDVIFAAPTNGVRSEWQLDQVEFPYTNDGSNIKRAYQEVPARPHLRTLRNQDGSGMSTSERQPKLNKGRTWIDSDNEPIHVFDNGPASLGERCCYPMDGPRVLGVKDADMESLATIFDWAPTAGKTLVAVSALLARGNSKPIMDFMQLYEQGLPTPDVFNNETALFAAAWREVNEKSCFVKIIVEYNQKRPIVHTYLRYAFEADEREQAITQIDRVCPGARRKWQSLLGRIRVFDPIRRHQFYRTRHMDFTPDEMDTLWASVLTRVAS
ncbi:hypothetical protein PFICI_14868 [Pestalotiopsis fici W106-1]|uniref:Uncharacterized protein n=1 Tax=Pestalotiopsis fici (strain W106-1 / CGMCC3.15140) TaxID=1229662 RepID=W3WHA8_PESFW|nr:uncharacterized protein PFICI_14868 [Pestalotiopsis fici W106-1]ETS73263.1 hypothetical protein PFICI_14868 [Pestalotiopsis fici W106-1]